MIRHFKDVHWDLRPHPDFGTLELRAMDSASDLGTLHALVALARSAVRRMANATAGDVAEIFPLDLPHWIDTENRFRAAHRGLDADYIVDKRGRTRPLRDVAADFISFCRDTAREIGESVGLAKAAAMPEGTPGYERQLDVYESNDSVRAVVNDLRKALLPAD